LIEPVICLIKIVRALTHRTSTSADSYFDQWQADQTSASSHELSRLAVSFNTLVAKFKL
jgi:methyl-accepting chemotaxis protein